MPKRIQRRRTKGWRMPKGAVYVGRPTKWGNPFVAGGDGHAGYDPHAVSAEVAVDSFRRFITREGSWSSIPTPKWPKGKIPAEWTTVDDVKRELRGKDLACWCAIISHGCYTPCHADVLISIANDIPIEDVIRENTRRAEG